MSTSDGDDLPDPEIETIRNLVGDAWRDIAERGGALIRLDGPGVRDNGVEIPVMTRVLTHFDRLVRIVAAHRSGLEVKRRGRIMEARGTRRLAAVAPASGSFALPLRLDNPEGELVVVDHREMEAVVELLEIDQDRMDEKLRDLPERTGDELVELLQATTTGQVDLCVVVLREGRVSARSEVTLGRAAPLARHLETTTWSEEARQVVIGTLFRIDTRNEKIAIDTPSEDDESSEVIEAMFSMDLLETLRAALHSYVEVQVDVREEKRPYERTSRSRSITVVSVRKLDG